MNALLSKLLSWIVWSSGWWFKEAIAYLASIIIELLPRVIDLT